jgi:hypothetical protein
MTKVKPGDGNFTKPVPTLEDIYERELVKKRHNCTDVICLLLFVVFCTVQVALSLLIYIKGGDPSSIILPHDSSGNVCQGSTPYLFYFNLYACASVSAAVTSCPSPTICVTSCPSQNLFYLIDSQRQILFNSYCIQTRLQSYYSNNVPSSVNYF